MHTPQIMEENGKRYRMLQVGETIEDGDEVNCYTGHGDERMWERYDGGWFGSVVTDPAKNVALPQGYYRRPIQ